MSIFKAYDIRGIYDHDWDRDVAYRIGGFLPALLEAPLLLVGHDARISSPEILQALTDGIRDAGAAVHCAGLATTPMIYFGTAHFDYPGSVQITASHNAREYNGLKISRAGSLPVGYDAGLVILERQIRQGTTPPRAPRRGSFQTVDIRGAYLDFLSRYPGRFSRLRLGVDCSNGMAALLIKDVLGTDENIAYLYDEIDGTFPHHEPNPLVAENIRDLQRLVVDRGLDMGVIFDGDGDRVMFVDEAGRFIPPDLIIALLGEHFLPREKGWVLHDIRTSLSVTERIREMGGKPYMWKVGHAYAKRKMRELDAVYGGELAGHYYFREFFYCDSGILAALLVLDIVNKAKEEGQTLSGMIKRIVRYACSGEINFRIARKREAMAKVTEYFRARQEVRSFYDFDGFRMEFDDWWFNIRPSNTEPYLRLVCEAADQDLLAEKLRAIRAVLAEFEEA
ncbi:MAG: phosphomannomutase/phosphoglucomutase [Acidobacteria bacterium]|nr:phosphomannomutase/phosphoglucomutase [Acidobacteriota bacterium]